MDFTKEIKAAMEPLAQDISALCQINSVEGEAEPGMPFGRGPAEALAAALEMGQRMGFRTENFGNYVGHIEYGDGEEMIGILGHLDVVPAGDGWERDPWGGEIADGRIWGRGTLDDKGPLLTCLYAMKILKDLNVPLKKRIRLILGTNEETNWGCMDYYLNQVKPEMPVAAFSPDSSFPVTFAELGMLQYTLSRDIDEEIEIEGGSAFNSVPSSAKVVLPAALEAEVREAVAASEKASIYQIDVAGDKLTLSVAGIGVHAKDVHEGLNAISYMMDILGKVSISGQLKEIVDFYNDHFGTTYFGEKIGITASDEISAHMTLNIGMIQAIDGKLTLYCDSRIPVSVSPDEIEKAVIDKMQGTGYTYKLASKENSLYVPKDSELVTTLMKAYQKVTGDTESQPMSSGGATYSRTIKNCVAFGCLLPDQVDTMHQANESLELDKLEIWLQICLEAIYQLAK